MHRRDVLAGLISLTALPLAGNTQSAIVPSLRSGLNYLTQHYNACRYGLVQQLLPMTLELGRHTCTTTVGQQHQYAQAILADLYSLNARLHDKLANYPQAHDAAKKAVILARESGDLGSIARATREIGAALRRQGQHTTANKILVTTALDVMDNYCPSERTLAAYVTLLCTAAFTAAKQGHKVQAVDLIAEAEDSARYLPAINAIKTQPSIYRVGIHDTLNDPDTALRYANQAAKLTLPSKERQARLYFDTARAWYQLGNLSHCADALRMADRFAPEDMRRPSAQRLVRQALDSVHPTPRNLVAVANQLGVRA